MIHVSRHLVLAAVATAVMLVACGKSAPPPPPKIEAPPAPAVN